MSAKTATQQPASKARRPKATWLQRHAWLTGMVVGQVAGFLVARTVGHNFIVNGYELGLGVLVPAYFTAVVLGGLAGGKILASFFPVQQKQAVKKDIRDHIFEALAETNKNLNKMIIEEEFNGAASSGGNGTDRFRLKAEPQLKPNAPQISTPKMGGMM